jgi:hypothetical protein
MGSLAGSFALAALLGSAMPQAQVQVPEAAQRAAQNAPLFATHEPIQLRIEGPLDSIFKERGAESRAYLGKVVVLQDGREQPLAAQIRTRGLARLRKDVCAFPPLGLNFDRDDKGLATSVFAGQNRLKLVDHCQDSGENEQYLLQEYLAYRVSNLLSEKSFRVRLARVRYVNTEHPKDTIIKPAFLIENQDRMAERNGWRLVEVSVVPPDAVDPAYLAMVELFEYFVGNPDWSAFGKGPGEEECCHNTQPIGNQARGPVFPVPYDFDITGIVNPRYGDRVFVPEERGLGITRIRQRVYRGLCASAPHLPAAIQLFNDKKDAIYALYRGQEGLSSGALDRSIEYIDAFYKTINDPKAVDREITKKCRSG